MKQNQKNSRCRGNAGLALVVAVGVFVFLLGWVGLSFFEAMVYTDLTGKRVTTWQAMFIQLRVIEPALPDKEETQ